MKEKDVGVKGPPACPFFLQHVKKSLSNFIGRDLR
jgi:hypothetical protein